MCHNFCFVVSFKTYEASLSVSEKEEELSLDKPPNFMLVQFYYDLLVFLYQDDQIFYCTAPRFIITYQWHKVFRISANLSNKRGFNQIVNMCRLCDHFCMDKVLENDGVETFSRSLVTQLRVPSYVWWSDLVVRLKARFVAFNCVVDNYLLL